MKTIIELPENSSVRYAVVNVLVAKYGITRALYGISSLS
jgi:hypothetical protein